MEKLWFGIKRENIVWFPTIDYDKCSGCLACVNKCTHGVFAEEDGKPKVINPNNCVIGCTGCEPVCPKNAISHPPKEYLTKFTMRKDFNACGCGGKCNK